MTGEFIQYDEKFVDDSGATPVEYTFMLARPGSDGSVSSSPFAPKSTTGDRSYADYDAISAIAFTDFSGGMGQERMTDVTRYYDGVDIDTRGARIILGPDVSTIALPYSRTFTPTSYITIDAAHPKYAQKVDTPAGMTKWRGAWLYLAADHGVGTVTVKLYDDVASYPTTELNSGTLEAGRIRLAGEWHYVHFTGVETVTPNASYWLSVEYAGTGNVYWLAGEATDVTELRYWDVGTELWFDTPDARTAFWVDDYEDRPDSPTSYIVGAGADNILRVWVYAGKTLYYIDNTPTHVGVLAAAGGSVKLMDGPIYDAVWYRAPSQNNNYLYLALGDSAAIQRFNGSIGAEEWVAQVNSEAANVYATRLAVHDNLLAFAYDRNKVDFFDGTNWGGSGATDYAEVGGREYQVRGMISWNGNLWVGKDDGLYKVTNPVGYPATSAQCYAQKIIDFSALADDTNFSMLTIHEGDLFFNIGSGILHFTTGNVLESIAPDTSLEVQATSRMIFRRAVSALNTLFVIGEAQVASHISGYTANATTGTTVLFAYSGRHWHPLHAWTGFESTVCRGMCIEPGWYGTHPRLWVGIGFTTSYMDMPTDTNRRWLVPFLTYDTTGTWYSSWLDGNIHSIEKDWMTVELTTRDTNYGTGTGTLTVYWRPDENTAWEQVGTTAANAMDMFTELTFPKNSHSKKCQLKIEIASPTNTRTPIIDAVVLKYMERPDDIRSFTRSYKLADRQTWRNGNLVTLSLLEQLEQLRTLREMKEPITWYAWYKDVKVVHIVDYTTQELPEELRETGDKGAMLAVVRLQEVG